MTVRRKLLLGSALALVAGAVIVVSLWPDPRLPSDVAARQLQTQLGVGWSFTCEPVENDGTISGLDDVDYFCQPFRPEQNAYWVGTDETRIVAIQSAG